MLKTRAEARKLEPENGGSSWWWSPYLNFLVGSTTTEQSLLALHGLTPSSTFRSVIVHRTGSLCLDRSPAPNMRPANPRQTKKSLVRLHFYSEIIFLLLWYLSVYFTGE